MEAGTEDRQDRRQAIEARPGKFPFWSGEDAGIAGHPHRFRHTFAKNLLVNGVSLETVSLLLGHKRLAITEKHYSRFVPERQAAIEARVKKSWARTGHTGKRA